MAAALAAVIERSVLGTHPVFDVPHAMALDDARSLLVYAGLGVAAAVASVVFTDGLLLVRRRFRELRRGPRWAQPAIGGLVTGVLAVGVMALLNMDGITGGGYGVLKDSLSGHLSVKVMLVLCVDAGGTLVGIIASDDVAILRAEPELELVVNAADLMRPRASVNADNDLRTAFELMRSSGLSELPVVDGDGRVVGLVAEADIAQAYLRAYGPESVRSLEG